MIDTDKFMEAAIEQAQLSLREGNNGFGAVLVKGNNLIAAARDTEETKNDATAHAEMNVIKAASKILGKDLTGCIMISTNEPCPMCAAALVWSNISKLAYGYSIKDALGQGRHRIDISCEEIFRRANKAIPVESGCLYDNCALLYNDQVRKEIKRLRNATADKLKKYNAESAKKRIKWFKSLPSSHFIDSNNKIAAAYDLLLKRLDTKPKHVPVVKSNSRMIVFHSMNFCPTLEACKILQLDTRYICALYNEQSTDIMIKQIDGNLQFSRNYKKLRPYTDYCEEFITIAT